MPDSPDSLPHHIAEQQSPPELAPEEVCLPGAIRSVYVHVPFCRHRCGYCDFSLVANRDDLIPRYLRALEMELQREFPEGDASQSSGRPLPLETLYIGGGTPTLLSAAELEHLLTLLGRFFRVEPGGEFTIEANPDQFTVEKQQLLAKGGVNRVSLGVQSFDDRYLRLLERTHSAQEARAVLEQTAACFPNFSLDLIFALPGQELAHWEQTLAIALAYAPPHISSYSLTYEKGTRFWNQQLHGQLAAIEESLEVRMYARAIELLESGGLSQYEISNYSRPGYESRHNQVYWVGKPYLACGPGASRFVGGIRQTNHRSPFTWMKRLEAGESPVQIEDPLTPEERARELFAIGLRRNAGVCLATFRDITGCEADQLLGRELEHLFERGWLQRSETHISLTPAGRLQADTIASELI